MSVLLYLPGNLVVLFKRTGLLGTVRHMLLLIATQAAIGLPFLRQYPWSYLKYSYEFTRVFLYKWTVNWRFVSEETFLSTTWARGLLIGHLTTLVAFGLWRWCRRDGGTWGVLARGLRSPSNSPAIVPVSADCRLRFPALCATVDSHTVQMSQQSCSRPTSSGCCLHGRCIISSTLGTRNSCHSLPGVQNTPWPFGKLAQPLAAEDTY